MLGNNSESISSDPDVACSSIDEVKRLRGRLSLKLLNTLDPYIDSIIHQTPFVTGYRMTSDDKWLRMGIEGFLYIVNRTRKPIHSFILVNKKSETHLIEYLTPEFRMNRNGNFIFYRSVDINTNRENLLQGLWFFDEHECTSTYKRLCDLTNNKSPLQYSLSSISSLYNDLNQAPVVLSAPEPEENMKEHELKAGQVKSIGSFLLDSINLKSSRTKQLPPEKNESPGIFKSLFKKPQEPKPDSNLQGKHLMTLLRTSAKVDRPDSPSESDSDSAKLLNSLELTDKDLVFASSVSSESNVTVNYETLKSVLSEVVQSEEFVSMVWEKLKTRSNP